MLILACASISCMTASLPLDRYSKVSVVLKHHRVKVTLLLHDNRAFKKKQSKAYDIKSTLPWVLLSTSKKGQQLGDLLGMIDFPLRERNE